MYAYGSEKSLKRKQTTCVKMDQDLNRYLTKDGKQHMRCSTSCNIKERQITIMRYYCISYPLGWPKSGTLTAPKAEKNVEWQEPHNLLMEMQNVTATLKDSLLFYQTENALTIQSNDSGSCYLPKETESTSTLKPAHRCLEQICSHLPKLESKLGCFSVGEWVNCGTSQ